MEASASCNCPQKLSCKTYEACACKDAVPRALSPLAHWRTCWDTSPWPRWGWPASPLRSQFSPHLLWQAFPNPGLGSGLPLNSHCLNTGLVWFLAMCPHEKVISVRSGRAAACSPAVHTGPPHMLGANKGWRARMPSTNLPPPCWVAAQGYSWAPYLSEEPLYIPIKPAHKYGNSAVTQISLCFELPEVRLEKRLNYSPKLPLNYLWKLNKE